MVRVVAAAEKRGGLAAWAAAGVAAKRAMPAKSPSPGKASTPDSSSRKSSAFENRPREIARKLSTALARGEWFAGSL